MPLTLSVDEHLVAEARRLAEAKGKSLDQLISEYLQDLVKATDAQDFSRQLRALTDEGHGRSQGSRFDRGALYERSQVP